MCKYVITICMHKRSKVQHKRLFSTMIDNFIHENGRYCTVCVKRTAQTQPHSVRHNVSFRTRATLLQSGTLQALTGRPVEQYSLPARAAGSEQLGVLEGQLQHVQNLPTRPVITAVISIRTTIHIRLSIHVPKMREAAWKGHDNPPYHGTYHTEYACTATFARKGFKHCVCTLRK